MSSPDAFTSYSEIIAKGWFENQYSHLEGVLQVLVDASRISTEQRRQLLALAREKQAGETQGGLFMPGSEADSRP
jgi:hypothetical protein